MFPPKNLAREGLIKTSIYSHGIECSQGSFRLSLLCSSGGHVKHDTPELLKVSVPHYLSFDWIPYVQVMIHSLGEGLNGIL